MHELAKKFVQNHHHLVVLTPGSRDQISLMEVEYLNNVEIWRFRAPNFRGKGKIWRAINETLFPFRALLALGLSKERKRVNFDLCINYSPTIFFAPVARYLGKKGAFVYLILRDFFPQWAVDQGLLKDYSIVTSFFRYVERLNYCSSDIIGVQSPANIPVFRSNYTGDANVQVLMNWSEQEQYLTSNQEASQLLRHQLGVEIDKTIFFYGGNLGLAQDMMNIIRLALDLLTDSRVHFLLVGQGDEFDLIKGAIEDNRLDNITLLPSVSQEKYREYVAGADVGMFSLAKTHTAHNFPGKLLGYMVESLPILGSVNPENDVADIINSAKAGLVSLNGDRSQLVLDAKFLINNVKARKKMGINAEKLLRKSFSVNVAYEKILFKYFESKEKKGKIVAN